MVDITWKQWKKARADLIHGYRCEECGSEGNSTTIIGHHVRGRRRQVVSVEDIRLRCVSCESEAHRRSRDGNHVSSRTQRGENGTGGVSGWRQADMPLATRQTEQAEGSPRLPRSRNVAQRHPTGRRKEVMSWKWRLAHNSFSR